MSKVPVLIAAKNEADSIGSTLRKLTTDAEPIVISNGCSDNTAEIAELYGAKVINSDHEGKMTALQDGLRYLGCRALEPFITLDADTRPIFPSQWIKSMIQSRAGLDQEKPAIVVGPIIFTGGTSVISSLYRTSRHLQRNIATRHDAQSGNFSGSNMLIHPKEGEVLETILDLPQIWPGEDAVIKDIIVGLGGNSLKSLIPGALVFSDSDRYPGLTRRILDGRNKTNGAIDQSYLRDAPPNCISGQQYQSLLTAEV